MTALFSDRTDAGRQLAQALAPYSKRQDIVVLALPRGGVPVAAVVAKELEAPLDVLIVRKVGLPNNPELAMGAVASGDVEIVNERVTKSWGIGRQEFTEIAQQELKEMARREELYRRGRPPLSVGGKLVILVDDGIATGSTVKAGVEAVKRLGASSVAIAVPVAAESTVRELRAVADEVICVDTPADFRSVGAHYRDFAQTSDTEVCELLTAASKASG